MNDLKYSFCLCFTSFYLFFLIILHLSWIELQNRRFFSIIALPYPTYVNGTN